MTDREMVVKGLKWILEGDRFGFGENWETGEPMDEYEKAGKIITDTITLLKEQEEQIERLEHDLAVTENNINHYVNGND